MLQLLMPVIPEDRHQRQDEIRLAKRRTLAVDANQDSRDILSQPLKGGMGGEA